MLQKPDVPKVKVKEKEGTFCTMAVFSQTFSPAMRTFVKASFVTSSLWLKVT